MRKQICQLKQQQFRQELKNISKMKPEQVYQEYGHIIEDLYRENIPNSKMGEELIGRLADIHEIMMQDIMTISDEEIQYFFAEELNQINGEPKKIILTVQGNDSIN
jgi:hypothetical protein